MAGKYDKRAAREAFLATLPDAATAPPNSLNLESPVSPTWGHQTPQPGEPNIPNLGSPVSPTWGQQQNPSLSNLGAEPLSSPMGKKACLNSQSKSSYPGSRAGTTYDPAILDQASNDHHFIEFLWMFEQYRIHTTLDPDYSHSESTVCKLYSSWLEHPTLHTKYRDLMDKILASQWLRKGGDDGNFKLSPGALFGLHNDQPRWKAIIERTWGWPFGKLVSSIVWSSLRWEFTLAKKLAALQAPDFFPRLCRSHV